MKGIKYDKEKLMWSLMPFKQLEYVVRVLMYGADKYPEPDNWKRVDNAQERYFNACMRHLIAWKQGFNEDTESHLPHLAHACCCILFLMWFSDGKIDKRLENLITYYKWIEENGLKIK